MRPDPELPPIDRLADFYPPRPGFCNYTAKPHTAAETYVVEDRGYFDASKRICHIHLLVKCNIAVWPKSWYPSFTPDDNRPPPREIIERQR